MWAVYTATTLPSGCSSIVTRVAEFIVTIMDASIEPITGDQPTPELRQTIWQGDACSRLEARRLADDQWKRTYGPQPTNVEVSIRLTDPTAQAAADWLGRVASMYAGIDIGEGDPVHAVRMKALDLLQTGPTRNDPFTIADEIAAALPGDNRAARLSEMWRDELSRLD